MKTNVEAYLDQNPFWKEVIIALRRILLEQDLAEDITGGQISYTYQGRNVALVQSYHDYLSLQFSKGVLLDDPKSLLQPSELESVISRQLTFQTVEQVEQLAGEIERFFDQAITLEKDTLKSTSQAER